MNQPPSDHVLRDVVASADRRRRARHAVRALVRQAPVAAGVALAVAVLARVAGWPAALPLGLLFAVAAVLVLVTWIRGRRRETTDAIAAAVDAEAALLGELRSAYWFEAAGVNDEWARFHVDRATGRAQAVDWASLYPAVRGGRSWVITTVLVAGAIVLSVGAPGRHLASAAGVVAGSGERGEALSAELQQKLAALLAQVKEGKLTAEETRASLAELKDLLARIDPALQKKLAEMLKDRALGADAQGKRKDLDAEDLAERAERGKNSQAGLPEDVRWALEDLAARLANADKNRQTNPDNPAASSETGEKGLGSDQAKVTQGTSAEGAMQMVREAASDPAAGKMMMGGGMMGGDSRSGAGGNEGAKTGAADALLVAQALRKELIEASADIKGENVAKEDIRRKTEQGKSALGFTRTTAAAFERSRADAPPAVPEARRPLQQQYFIRK